MNNDPRSTAVSTTGPRATPHPGTRTGNAASSDPGGPLVVVCTGHRCAGLRRLAGLPEVDAELRQAVRGTRGAVLLDSVCLGVCAHGPAAAIGHRLAGSTSTCGVPLTCVTGLDDEERCAGLVRWVRAGGGAAPWLPAPAEDEQGGPP